jgi:hypothetical protein
MAVITQPCDWLVSYAACSDEQAAAMTAAQKAQFEEMASTFLWNWTRRQFGTCPIVIRPCRQDCLDGPGSTFWGRGPYPMTGGSVWTSALVNGSWASLTCGACGEACSCADGSRDLVLPGPVHEVTRVLLDGVELVAGTDYRLDGDRLLRLGGERWPSCQDMTAATSEANTWEVHYTHGVPVPSGGQVAAGMLTVELFKASCNDATCMLPKRIQNITRQGVTVTLLDNFENLEKGQTGIWLVDAWVASVTKTVNPPGRVYSPDIPRPKNRRMTTGPGPSLPVDGGTF